MGERRASGEQKYYLSNLPADTALDELAATIKARLAGPGPALLWRRIERGALDGCASKRTSS